MPTIDVKTAFYIYSFQDILTLRFRLDKISHTVLYLYSRIGAAGTELLKMEPQNFIRCRILVLVVE
jgi:hypothetical protein